MLHKQGLDGGQNVFIAPLSRLYDKNTTTCMGYEQSTVQVSRL